MSNNYYELYCDESGTNEGKYFYFGAIHCSPKRAEILGESVARFRKEHQMFSEMKWDNVSKSKLPQYKAFTSLFLDDPYASFILSTVTKGRHWRKLAKSNDGIFMQAYFYFLEGAMLRGFDNRYRIFLDDSSISDNRFNRLRFCINKPGIRVSSLKTVNSKHNSLIQLVDVILGAMSSEAKAAHKVELSRYVKAKFSENIKPRGMAKLRNLEWIAPEHRDFIPSI